MGAPCLTTQLIIQEIRPRCKECSCVVSLTEMLCYVGRIRVNCGLINHVAVIPYPINKKMNKTLPFSKLNIAFRNSDELVPLRKLVPQFLVELLEQKQIIETIIQLQSLGMFDFDFSCMSWLKLSQEPGPHNQL